MGIILSMIDLETLNFDQMQVISALYEVYDPEVGVNIVDLGLVRAISFEPKSSQLEIVMTLTSPACPLTEELEEEISEVLEPLNLVSRVRVSWSVVPPWSLEQMSDEGRSQLRALGF